MVTIKSAKIDNGVSEIVDLLGINFSKMTNDYFKEKFLTLKGFDEQIKQKEKELKLIKKKREELHKFKLKMSNDEKKYLIETESVIKKDKKFIKIRIQAIYKMFGKIIESEKELKQLIEVAKK